METVKEIKERYEGKYTDIEYYVPATINSKVETLHTDSIKSIPEDDIADDAKVLNYELMDEEDYNHSVAANTDKANFEEWYDDKDAKVLVICVDDRDKYKGE